ncbi:hypothetical protein niasHT_009637 [Heterodera trifolii]|uniref:Uncharacterized protein n=1 Tax=Heterodera trifolii TaxID=157864 RepID=A0ABD2LWR1_9BILA
MIPSTRRSKPGSLLHSEQSAFVKYKQSSINKDKETKSNADDLHHAQGTVTTDKAQQEQPEPIKEMDQTEKDAEKELTQKNEEDTLSRQEGNQIPMNENDAEKIIFLAKGKSPQNSTSVNLSKEKTGKESAKLSENPIAQQKGKELKNNGEKMMIQKDEAVRWAKERAEEAIGEMRDKAPSNSEESVPIPQSFIIKDILSSKEKELLLQKKQFTVGREENHLNIERLQQTSLASNNEEQALSQAEVSMSISSGESPKRVINDSLVDSENEIQSQLNAQTMIRENNGTNEEEVLFQDEISMSISSGESPKRNKNDVDSEKEIQSRLNDQSMIRENKEINNEEALSYGEKQSSLSKEINVHDQYEKTMASVELEEGEIEPEIRDKELPCCGNESDSNAVNYHSKNNTLPSPPEIRQEYKKVHQQISVEKQRQGTESRDRSKHPRISSSPEGAEKQRQGREWTDRSKDRRRSQSPERAEYHDSSKRQDLYLRSTSKDKDLRVRSDHRKPTNSIKNYRKNYSPDQHWQESPSKRRLISSEDRTPVRFQIKKQPNNSLKNCHRKSLNDEVLQAPKGQPGNKHVLEPDHNNTNIQSPNVELRNNETSCSQQINSEQTHAETNIETHEEHGNNKALDVELINDKSPNLQPSNELLSGAEKADKEVPNVEASNMEINSENEQLQMRNQQANIHETYADPMQLEAHIETVQAQRRLTKKAIIDLPESSHRRQINNEPTRSQRLEYIGTSLAHANIESSNSKGKETGEPLATTTTTNDQLQFLLSQIQGSLQQILEQLQAQSQDRQQPQKNERKSSGETPSYKNYKTNCSNTQARRELDKFVRSTNKANSNHQNVQQYDQQVNITLDDNELLLFIVVKIIKHPISINDFSSMWLINTQESSDEILLLIDQLRPNENFTAESILEMLSAVLCLFGKDPTLLTEVRGELQEFEGKFDKNLPNHAALIVKQLKILFLFIRLFRKSVFIYARKSYKEENLKNEAFVEWLCMNNDKIGNQLFELGKNEAAISFVNAARWLTNVQSLEKELATVELAILLTLPTSMKDKVKSLKDLHRKNNLYSDTVKNEFLSQFKLPWINPWRQPNFMHLIRAKTGRNVLLNVVINLKNIFIEQMINLKIEHSDQLGPDENRMVHRKVFFSSYLAMNKREFDEIRNQKLDEARNKAINYLTECLHALHSL